MNTLVRPENSTFAAGEIRPADYRHPVAADPAHPLRRMGPKYPPHNANAPILEGIDLAGLAAGIAITLGPLAAYALGMGA